MNTYRDRLTDAIEAFERATFHREDGKEMDLSFAPPVDDAVLEAIERKAGHPLADEFTAFAQMTRGFEGTEVLHERMRLPERPGGVGGVTNRQWGLDPLVQFGHDGAGNYMYIGVRREGTPVWYLCHDPPAIVLMARSIAGFLEQRLAYLREAEPYHAPLTEEEAAEADSVSVDEMPRLPERDYETVDAQRLEAVDLESLPEEVASTLRDFPPSTRLVDLRGHQTPVGYPMNGRKKGRSRWVSFGEMLTWTPYEVVRSLEEGRVPELL